MKLFVTENDSTTGNLFIGLKNNKLSSFDNEEDAKKFFENEKYEKHEFVFRKINFGISRKLQEKSFVMRDGSYVFDPIAFRFERCLSTLKSWNLIDESGNSVPITKEAIESLDSGVANSLLLLCDKLVQ
jgi:hypothetical protein